MRFQHILHALHCEPWLIMPSFHATLCELVQSKLAGDAAGFTAAAAGEGFFGDELPKMTVEGGVAEIPIVGPIGKGLGNLEKSCGACSIDDVQRNLAEASDRRRDVGSILLRISSPGGSVTGIPETGAMIAGIREKKPVVAFSDSMCASAAYWLASQASTMIATPSANVGSIGVYIPWSDTSKRTEMQGIKVGIVKNKEGVYKGAGFPGVPYTEAQMAHLQERADELFGMFKSAVTSSRRRVNPDALQGQTLLGAKAVEAGLVDSIDTHINAWAKAYAMANGSTVASNASSRETRATMTAADAVAEYTRLQSSGDSRAAGRFYAENRTLILSR